MICIPISANTNEEMIALLAKAAHEPGDLVELRFDSLTEPPDVETLLAAARQPVIAACRARREGGGYDGSVDARRDILARAVRAGAAFVDAEPADIVYLAPNKRDTALIASFHDFSGTPDNLASRVADLEKLPCDWVKFVVTAHRPADNIKVFDLMAACYKPCIGVAMGEEGLMTRVLGMVYGSRIAFGSLDPSHETAAGQPTARDLFHIYRVKELTRHTKVYGLLGNPVAQSRGYRLHNRAFAQTGHDGVYIPFRAESATDFLDTVAPYLNLRGLSVTIPHKPAAIAWAKIRSKNSTRIGAANTLTRTPEGWRADNTDMPAIFESIKAVTDAGGMNLTGASALLLGAGGTTRAAGLALSLLGCKVTVAARDPEKAFRVASQMDWDVESMQDALPADWTVVANTTPVGMYPNIEDTVFPAQYWKPGMLAFDAVHNPRQTRFLRDAAEAGALIVDGVDMFIRQGAEQFRMWTGQEMPKLISLL